MATILDPPQTTELAVSVAEVAQVDWDLVDRAELLTAAVELARARSQLDAALVRVAERLEVTGAAADAGWATAKDFLTHVSGGRKGAGGSLLRIAKHTAELPQVRAAQAAGAISTAQAGVIGARVATLPRVPELRERAADRLLELVNTERYDATDLDRAFASVVGELDPDGSLLGADLALEKAERGAHHARYLSFSEDAVGGVRIRGYASIEDAEQVKATLMPLAAPHTTERGACGGDPDHPPPFHRDVDGHQIGPGCPEPVCTHNGADRREPSARLWDALVEACGRLRATDDVPHAHGTSARLTVTIDFEALRDRLEESDRSTRTGRRTGGLLAGGASLSVAAVRRLGCDAEIIPAVLGGEGQILDVGRARRLVTAAIWIALVLRDRHCAFPGCQRLPIACEAHHIVHWADGGPTSLDNLVLLCRRHHTITHQTPWRVHLDPHTRRPVWTPPPPIDVSDRFTFVAAGRPPPQAA